MTNRPLRVAIIGLNYAPERTGIARYTSSLAQGLKERHHAVRVITTHPHYPDWRVQEGYGQWRREEVVEGVQVRRLKHFVPRKPSWIPRALGELSFGLRALFTAWGKPDVVILPSPALFSSSLVMARARIIARKVATVVWVQDLYSVGAAETRGSGGVVIRLLSRIEASTLRSANGVAVIHPRFRDRVISEFGVEPDRVGVIRNWASIGNGRPTEDRAVVRSRLGWSAAETIAMHAGNMGEKQGLENIVEAARLAEQDGLPIRFVFSGGGSRKSELVKQAASLSNVAFLDSLPEGEFENVLNSADVLLLNEKPGVAEMAVPSKLTTYFSTGLPVVAATDSSSITAQELRDSGGGIRVDPGDPAALLAAVSRLSVTPQIRTVLGEAGLKFRSAYLAEDKAIDSYVDWLHKIAD